MSGDTDGHVDFPGLLSGDLPPAERDRARAHLRGCAACRDEMLDAALLVGELHDAGRHSPVEPSEVPPLRLPALDVPQARTPLPAAGGTHRPPRPDVRRSWATRLALAAAAVGVAAIGLATGRATAPDDVSQVVAAPVRLTTVTATPTALTGAAEMVGAGRGQKMHVTLAGLPRVPGSSHYEVWLLDTRTGRTFAVGALPQGAASTTDVTFALPADQATGFNAIDVSLQTAADGETHSGNSLLRGAI